MKLFLIAGRLVYSHQIRHDSELKGVQAKNETIVDDLGAIDLILSDKTGTITKNEMKMSIIAIDK